MLNMKTILKRLLSILCISSVLMLTSCEAMNTAQDDSASISEITSDSTINTNTTLESSTDTDILASAIVTYDNTDEETSYDDVSQTLDSAVVSNTNDTSQTTEQTDTEILQVIQNMTTYEKICQLFIVTPEQLVNANGNNFSTVTEAGETTQVSLEQYPVAGVIYFSQNVVSREQLITMNSNLQEFSKYGLFISVDEEGGEISRLAKNNIEGVTHLQDMSSYENMDNSVEEVSKVGTTLGSELKALGFNVDFAPVADIEINPNNTMGERMFSSDPQTVADLVSAEVIGMQSQGVCATLKHFPGLGATESDTHYGSVVLNRTLEELTSTEFVPFKEGINSGVEFVMVSHAVAVGIGDDEPSDLSKEVVTDLLRNTLGFNGIAITDAHTGMASITDKYTSAQATTEAIKAGIDIVLMPDDLNSSISAIETAIQNGEISIERIEESVYRILSVKKEYGILKSN